MTPEGKVKDKVKKLLRMFGVYYHMPVQNGMGAPTLDFICCPYGLYLGIETKAEGGKPTPRQLRTMREIVESGGWIMVVENDRSLHELSELLRLMKGCVGGDRLMKATLDNEHMALRQMLKACTKEMDS